MKRVFSGLVVVVAMLVGMVGVSSGVVFAAASPSPSQPTSITVTRSAPDAHGGTWVHIIRVWKTSYPLTRPNSQGNVFLVSLGGETSSPDLGTGGGSCGSGYTTLDNSWHYNIGPLWFLTIDFWSQDEWNSCNLTVTNKYVDPQCRAFLGSTCLSQSAGVFHDVSCVPSGVFGVCNQDWANINTINGWNGQNDWEYLRTWVDSSGDNAYSNNTKQ